MESTPDPAGCAILLPGYSSAQPGYSAAEYIYTTMLAHDFIQVR